MVSSQKSVTYFVTSRFIFVTHAKNSEPLRNKLNKIKCKVGILKKEKYHGCFFMSIPAPYVIWHQWPTKAHLGSKVNALDPLTISWSCNVWAVRVWASYSDVLTVSLHPSISEEDSNIQWWIRPATKAAIFICVCATIELNRCKELCLLIKAMLVIAPHCKGPCLVINCTGRGQWCKGA